MKQQVYNILVDGLDLVRRTEYMNIQITDTISKNQSMVILDPRLEHFNANKKTLEESGYDVKIINFRNPSESNFQYNLLSNAYQMYKAGNVDQAIDELKIVADNILKKDLAGDAFWDSMATDLFLSLALLCFFESDREVSLKDLYIKLDQLEKNNSYKEVYEKLDVLNPIYVYGSNIAFAPMETRGGIVVTFQNRFNDFVAKTSLLNLIDTTTLNLDVENKIAIFVVTKDEMGIENLLAKALIAQLFSYLYQHNKMMKFILNDYQTIASPGYLYNFLSTCSQRGIEVVIAANDYDFMEKDFVKKYFTFLE